MLGFIPKWLMQPEVPRYLTKVMVLEFGVPKFLQDELGHGPKGQVVGTHGDLEEETRLIQSIY